VTEPNANRVRRWGALALLIILPPVLVMLAVANVASTADLRMQAAFTAGQADRLRARLETQPTAPETGADTDLVLQAASRSLAEAELQRRLVDLGEAAATKIVESGAGALTDAEAAKLLEVRATFDGRNASLLQLLYAIETGLPLMTVIRLDVRRLGGEEDALDTDPILRIEVVVRAPWKAAVS
jgi:general secretion pathway protein M